MPDPHASALDALFHAPGSETADHLSTFDGTITEGVRVIRARPDREFNMGEGRYVAGTMSIDIRMSELHCLRDGDRLIFWVERDGERVKGLEIALRGEPRSDVENMTWNMDAEEVGSDL
jgi:hypothetical protein